MDFSVLYRRYSDIEWQWEKDIKLMVMSRRRQVRQLKRLKYAGAIRLDGWCIYGVTIVQIYQFIMENSIIINFFKEIY